MARHRAERPDNALETDDELESAAEDVEFEDDEPDEDDDQPDDEDEPDDESEGRPAAVDKFWAKVRLAPVEIALPRGVGYTLRAYRMSDTLGTEEAGGEEPEQEPADEVSEEVSDQEEPAGRRKRRGRAGPEDDEEDEADEADREDEDLEDEDLDEADEDEEDKDEEDEEEEDEEEEEPEPEEIPVFLTQDRQLLLFRSPEGLVDFVRSGEATDLDVVDEWGTLRTELSTDHVVPGAEDRYELDLVVENLRGGRDAWDTELLVKAGELCRDLGHALRIESVMSALQQGSPLDNLDEALRATERGAIGAFFARRKLRRIGAQQAALAWRSIIGKISTSVDWRD